MVAKLLVRSQLVLLRVGRDLVSVHAHHGHLDWASKVVIVVTEMVCGGLKLILADARGVINNLVEDWLSCGNRGFVRDEVEIEINVSLILYQCSVDNCAWARVETLVVAFSEDSVLDVSVNEAVNNLGLVLSCFSLKELCDHLHLIILD